MLIESKIILLIIGLHVVLAWLPPERCKQEKFLRTKRDSIVYSNFIISAPNALRAPVVNNITQIALNQNKNLNEKYNNTQFFGVPIRVSGDGLIGSNYEMYAPNECKFHTYNPSLLSSVYCQEGVECKLTHAVSTTKSYTASEGYNWGSKISAKASLFGFEIGGEASKGGSYTCTYTEGRTTTDTVECSVAADAAAGKTLQLYNVQSDMECQFSTVTMVPDTRSGKIYNFSTCANFTAEDRLLTIKNAIFGRGFPFMSTLPDIERMSDELWERMKFCYPDYSPYTDLLNFYLFYDSSDLGALYYKQWHVAAGPKRIIPFTNENGNSVYQYACVLT